MWFKDFYRHIPKAMWEKRNFYLRLPKNASVLDIGCGNGSPAKAKYLRPDIFYAGIDIGNYNNSEKSLSMADVYLTVEAEKFPEGISDICGEKNLML